MFWSFHFMTDNIIYPLTQLQAINCVAKTTIATLKLRLISFWLQSFHHIPYITLLFQLSVVQFSLLLFLKLLLNPLSKLTCLNCFYLFFNFLELLLNITLPIYLANFPTLKQLKLTLYYAHYSQLITNFKVIPISMFHYLVLIF